MAAPALKKPKPTAKEEKEASIRRKRLEELFPGLVAEICAITRHKSPMMDPPYIRGRDDRNTNGTSIPMRVHEQTGGTHPISGHPEFQPKVIEIPIWPGSARTDQLPELRPWYPTSYHILDYLAKKENGWGTLYRLKKVPAELIEIEKTASMDPISAALWSKLQADYQPNRAMVADGVASVSGKSEDDIYSADQEDTEDYLEDDDAREEDDVTDDVAAELVTS